MNKTFLFSVAFAAISFLACTDVNIEAPNENNSSSGISKRSSSGNSGNSGISSSSAGNSGASSSGENSGYSSSGESSSQSGDYSSGDGNSSQDGDSSSGGNSSQGGNSSPGAASSSSRTSNSSSSSLIPSSSSLNGGSWPKLQKGQAGVQEGWASRYWDGCKAHCSHRENVDTAAVPFSICKNCNSNNEEIPAFAISPDANEWWTGYKGTPSSCEQGGVAFTCFDMAPLKINDTLSYAFAAAPGTNAACGQCYQLQFNGSTHNGTAEIKEAHRLINGKTLIILANNIGHDVAGGQFDILIPGGGVGAYDSFTNLLGVNKDQMGATFGGFLTTCQQSLNDYNLPAAKYKECVAKKCNDVFGKSPKFADLLRGCLWFTDWYEAADNPTFLYKEVQCPQYLTDKYRSKINTKKDTDIKWASW
jgi:hypothetical protein